MSAQLTFDSVVKALLEGKAGLDEETLLTFGFVTGTAIRLLQFFIGSEFKSADPSQATIMRENSPTSRLLKAYVRRVGQPYLTWLLGDFANQLCGAERKVSLEINPSFTDPDECEKNKKMLLQKLTILTDRITSQEAIDNMPVGIR